MNAKLRTFRTTATREGRHADAAWATGALDAMAGREARSEGSTHPAEYLSGWCKGHGI